MLTYGESELRRADRLGLKRVLARTLSVPALGWAAEAAARRILPQAKLHRLPVSKREVAYHMGSSTPVILTNPAADLVAKDIYWGGGKPTSPSEQKLLHFVEEASQGIRTFVDAGSYSALFAMIAAKANPAVRVIAYEIVPENYLLIIANIIENDLVGRVEARHTGLGSEPSTLTMPRRCNTVAQPTSLSLGSRFSEGISVPVTTLDVDLAGIEGPLLIKIDVEGYEWPVIRGAQETISRLRPTMICEFLPQAVDHRAVEEFLKPLGYRFYIARDAGFEQRDSIVPDRDAWNWVLSAHAM